jgi:Putative peptidoglycan binding domain
MSTPNNKQPTGPVGQGNYLIKQGDCLSSIAYEHGFFWETLWKLPDNRPLQESRKNPNALLPGDALTVPPTRRKQETGAIEEVHRFRLKGVPETLRVRFLDAENKPRANLPYVLTIDGATHTGKTNADGELKHSIEPNAKKGELVIGEGEDAEEIPLNLGHLDPVSEISGVQMRLLNLGFACGAADGVLGPRTRSAIERFQRAAGLKPTGDPDEATQKALEKQHGC